MDPSNEKIRNFLGSIGVHDGADRTHVLELVQSVARIPWGEGRTIEEVLETKHVGTCTGKHLLLSTCFDVLKVPYRVTVCTFRWSEQGITLPKHLSEILKEGEWLHGHNFLQIQSSSGEWIDLDVTWDPALDRYGFQTFPENWKGETSFLGVRNIHERLDGADTSKKNDWLSALSPEMQERRGRFLKEFFAWIHRLRESE